MSRLLLLLLASAALLTALADDSGVDPTTGCHSPSILRTMGKKRFNFSGVQEVQFLGVVGPVEQKRVCKIKCVNGQWLGPLCSIEEALQCPTLAVEEPHLQIDSQSIQHKGKATFSCRRGYRLAGPHEILCLYGNWSDFMPTCEEVVCERPLPPENGRILDEGRYTVDAHLQIVCDDGHKFMGESPTLECQQDGSWSHQMPTCKPACDHPGDPTDGRTLPSKDHYDINDWVTVMCNSGFMIHGTQRLRCDKPGKWTHPLPECKPFRI